MMKFIRLYTGNDGQSHFEELSLESSDSPYGRITSPLNVEHVMFGETEAEEISWHNPPVPQYVIMLKGEMEIEVGDGSKKVFYEGDILLAEDTTGQGHMTRTPNVGAKKYMVITKK